MLCSITRLKIKQNIKMSSIIPGIQKKLLENHDQLRHKAMILPYFVSLQFPEKQRRLVLWWANIIQHAIRYSNQVYLSPSDIELVFTMYQLKPIPLRAVLQTISESDNFEWRQKKVQNLVQPSQSKIKQFIASVLSAIIPQKSIKSQLSNYKSLQKQTDSKIISVVYMTECLQKVKQAIKNQLELSTCISYNKALTAVRQNVPLSIQSIKYLIKELDDRLWLIAVPQQNEIKFLIVSEQAGKYQNKNWVQIQKSIYRFNEVIQVLTARLQKQNKAQKSEVNEAKQCLLQKNQKKARNILQMVKLRRKKIQYLQIRIKTINQQLHRLQMSQNNQTVLEELQKSNKLLKNIQVDVAKIDDILQQNMEIQQRQREINHGFKQINEQNQDMRDDDMDEVDLMMKELETEVKIGKQKQNQKQKNMKPSGQSRQNQQRQTDKNI